MQLMQQTFKVAFLYGQLHEQNKKDENYKHTDLQTQAECVKICTSIMKS